MNEDQDQNNYNSELKDLESSYASLKAKYDFSMSTVGKIAKLTIQKWYYSITIPAMYVFYKLLSNEAFQKAVEWVLNGYSKGIQAANGIISNCLVTNMGGLLNFFECVGRQ